MNFINLKVMCVTDLLVELFLLFLFFSLFLSVFIFLFLYLLIYLFLTNLSIEYWSLKMSKKN